MMSEDVKHWWNAAGRHIEYFSSSIYQTPWDELWPDAQNELEDLYQSIKRYHAPEQVNESP